MKKTTQKKQSKSPVLYPPTFHPVGFDEHLCISYSTGMRRAVSPDDIADGLEQLAQLAALSPKDNSRSIIARHHLYNILENAVARMNQLARKNPGLWREAAQTSALWPVSTNKTPMQKRRTKELLNLLDVGKRIFPRVHPKSQLHTDKSRCQCVVVQLIGCIGQARSMADFYHEHHLHPAPGWRRDALKLELPADTDAKRAKWKKAAEAVLREGGYEAAQFGPDPVSTKGKTTRKESYPRMKFWQMFNGQLTNAGKHLQSLESVTTLTP